MMSVGGHTTDSDRRMEGKDFGVPSEKKKQKPTYRQINVILKSSPRAPRRIKTVTEVFLQHTRT